MRERQIERHRQRERLNTVLYGPYERETQTDRERET